MTDAHTAAVWACSGSPAMHLLLSGFVFLFLYFFFKPALKSKLVSPSFLYSIVWCVLVTDTIITPLEAMCPALKDVLLYRSSSLAANMIDGVIPVLPVLCSQFQPSLIGKKKDCSYLLGIKWKLCDFYQHVAMHDLNVGTLDCSEMGFRLCTGSAGFY